MAHTIDQYMDAAIARNRLKSDRHLGRELGITGASINAWRLKKSWPADSTMISLARLSGMDETLALIDLNTWRAKSGIVAHAYERIGEQIKRARAAAAVIVILLGGLLAPTDGTAGEQSDFANGQLIDYTTIRRRVIRSIARARRWLNIQLFDAFEAAA